MKDALGDRQPEQTLLGAVLLLLTLAVIPHAFHLSPWIVGFYLLALAWRLLALRHARWLPGRWLLFLLLLVGLANVVLHAGVRDGRTAGTALLVAMLGMKVLELRNRRDVIVCIFLGFFVGITQFLFTRSLGMALYLLLVNTGLVTLLIGLNQVHFDLRRSVSTSLLSLVAALPMALLLFLVFPRLSTPLWAIRINEGNGITGMTDTMQVGSIGRLSESNAPAFYVQFRHAAPPPAERYWRGLVLSDFDGRTWTADPSPLGPPRALRVDQAQRIDYQLTMEPSNKPWLFVLAMPGRLPPNTQLDSDYQLQENRPITQRTLIRLSAYPDYQALDLTPEQRRRDLALPPDFSPRVRALALRWEGQDQGNPQAIVHSALNYFRTQGFAYTLTPGIAQGNPTADFLFRSKRGFCGSYASSFTLLMRAAGIPARVVVGYLGGRFNPIAGQWTIRQSDAHAWSEVWMPGRGWQRVDPTAAVAPERIDRGINPALSETSGHVVFISGNPGLLQALVRQTRWLITATDLGWHQWVIGYSRQRQEGLLKRLGLEGEENWLIAGGLILTLTLGTLTVYLLALISPRRHRDPAARSWEALLRKLRHAGLTLPPWAGPQLVLERAVRRWPRKREGLARLVHAYVSLRYAPGRPTRQQLRSFKRAVQLFKLK